MPPKAMCCSRWPAIADYGKLSRRDRRRHAGRRARRSGAVQARSRRFRAVEALAPTTCRAGTRPGAAAARAGTSNARRWPRRTSARPSTSMPAASTCSSRTTRTKSRRATARTAARRSRASGCTTACSTSAAPRCRSRWATSACCTTCCAQHPPEALRYALLSAHYRQPLDWSDALIEQSVRTLDRLYGTLRDLADVEADAGAIPAEHRSGAVRRPQYARGAGRTCAHRRRSAQGRDRSREARA